MIFLYIVLTTSFKHICKSISTYQPLYKERLQRIGISYITYCTYVNLVKDCCNPEKLFIMDYLE